MSRVIAFWNISPWDSTYYQGQLIGTITVDDGGDMVASPEDSIFLQNMMKSERTPDDFVAKYSDYASVSGTGSRLLGDGEEPKDLVYNKYVVSRAIPGGEIVTEKSYTIDEEGVWHKDAKES